MFKKMSLANQLAILVIVITTVVFIGAVAFVSYRTSEDALKAVEHELDREVQLIAGNFEFFHRNLVARTGQLGNAFFNMFKGEMRIDSGSTVRVGKYDAPLLLNNGEVVNGNFDKPDEFTRMTGGTATIFMRYGDDFLRISTSLRKENGDRAFGTLLGKAHPGYETLMRGETYAGPADLFGHNYMTKYIPFKDSAGKVIGILYVGFDYTKAMKFMKKQVSEIKFGETGYVYAINASKGKKQGQLVLHPSLVGKNLLELGDADGNKVFNKFLDADSGVLHYKWKDAEDNTRDKLVSFRHVKGWNWVVAAGSYTDEFTRDSASLRTTMIIISGLSVVVIAALVFIALRKWLQPLSVIASAIEALGRGDLRTRIDIKGATDAENTANEIHFLAGHLNKMIAGLRELIGGIVGAVDSMTLTSDQVAAISSKTSQGVSQQLNDVDMVATAINEMAATVQEVAGSALAADAATQDSNAQAHEGSDVVEHVASSIQQLAAEVEASAEVIARVEQESESIDTVLEVIRGIAEQTNLLALNAAIEAARAGEQGRGFAVVADEVRNLAQKTQSSTVEIRGIIESLQSSTKLAVDKMQNGREQAQASVEQVNRAGEVLKQITDSVSTITQMTAQIATATEEQSRVAEEVNQSVVNIRDISSETAQGANEMIESTHQLQSVAQELRQSTSRFTV